jgi:hypothetical protein
MGGPDIQLAGICFSADDWGALDEDTRSALLACGDDGGDEWDEAPTLIRPSAAAPYA